MIDTVIVSGGDIQSDFALDFLKKNAEKAGKEKIRLIAADRGLEFFLEQQILPDVVIGDFDSLSEEGKEFLEVPAGIKTNSEIPYGGMTNWKVQKQTGEEKKEVEKLRDEDPIAEVNCQFCDKIYRVDLNELLEKWPSNDEKEQQEKT